MNKAYEQAKKDGLCQRYLACIRALGREPGIGEYPAWNRARIREFWKEPDGLAWGVVKRLNVCYSPGCISNPSAITDAYDQWLMQSPIPEHWKDVL